MSGISLATIKDPEFINLQPLDINPLMSSCEIKVLYLGQNRNKSYITKEVATEMAKTLRGAPIVGWYCDEKGDFKDHGEQLIIDGDGIQFNCLTKPYGFVSPDAQVWFQEFEDTDDFGNKILREYLMTTGYLWTGQYPELSLVNNEGRPQSMELDEKTLQGKWSNDINSNIEFFIINDAIFSKLCILGEDVEPCFEGAEITKPDVSKSFTYMNDFKQSLFNMMQEFRSVLEGGKPMGVTKPDEYKVDPVEEEEEEQESKEVSEEEEQESEEISEEEEQESEEEEQESEDEEEEEDNDDQANRQQERYSILIDRFNQLQSRYEELSQRYNDLVTFKSQIEEKQKRALIDSFYMLSDEDKKEVVENIDKYTLDDIEAKLSVICVRKKVNFDLEDNKEKNNGTPITTFNIDNAIHEDIPAWVSAVKDTQRARY